MDPLTAGLHAAVAAAAPDMPEAAPIAEGALSLTPKRFAWMLAYTGLEDVWEAVEAHAKEADRALYADLRAQRRSAVFELDATLTFLAREDVRRVVAAAAPDTDVSEEAVRAAWARAQER